MTKSRPETQSAHKIKQTNKHTHKYGIKNTFKGVFLSVNPKTEWMSLFFRQIQTRIFDLVNPF